MLQPLEGGGKIARLTDSEIKELTADGETIDNYFLAKVANKFDAKQALVDAH
ncbi:hypothetical protein [Undibacterium jejuense]|nr:hypothetical protein [Undibacterium jejuense]